jgi:hypothetical protein
MSSLPQLAAVAALLLAVPAAAPAALALRIGEQSSPATMDAECAPDRHGFLDLVFEDTNPTDNEGLFAYDLSLRLIRPPGVPAGRGVRLTGAERPAQNFVLDVPSGATFTVAESTPDWLLINVASNNDLANVDARDVAARVFFYIEPDVGAFNIGDYAIVFDTQSTVFGSGDPNRPLEIPLTLTDAGIIRCWPEPSTLSLLGGAALLALRRRHRAQPRAARTTLRVVRGTFRE